MKKTHDTYRLWADGVLAALTAVGTYIMLTTVSQGILIASGAQNLQFFTVDSNLLFGLVCLSDLVLGVTGVLQKNERVRLWMDRLWYIAAVAVSLTFTVVVVMFGPLVGYAPLFQDANLYFHLIVPVLGIVSFCAFHRDRAIPLGETAAALIPSLVYGAYYTAVLLVRGVHYPDTDWYGFAAGGIVGSVLTACAVFLITWVLALLLRLGAGGTKKRVRQE